MNVAFVSSAPFPYSSLTRASSPLTSSAFRPAHLPHRICSPPHHQPATPPISMSTRRAANRPNPLSVLVAALPLILFPAVAPAVTNPTTTSASTTATVPAVRRNGRRIASAALRVVRPAHAKAGAQDVPVVPADPPRPAPIASVRDRMSFYISEFLMWNPAAKIITLLAFTLLSMFMGSFLYRLADPGREEASSPFWHSVRAIANPLEDDWQKNSLRATSIFLAGFGMVVFAILVGMVTETVESAVRHADGENSRVVVSDHILVCGWESHVAQIIKDINNVSTNVKVVVLAAPDKKDVMMEEIRSTLSEAQRNNVRMFYRPGAPIIAQDLERVAAARARKIILVNTRGSKVDGDRLVLSRALALRQNLPSFTGDVVAELNNVRDEGILRSILSKSHARSVETVNTEQLLFRFMAQAIRQPGLAEVVALLMGDNPSTVFHVSSAKQAAPQLIGTSFADLRPTSVPGSILCGFIDSTGRVHIENGNNFSAGGSTVDSSTKFLLLGTSKSMGKTTMASRGHSFDISPSTSSMLREYVKGRSLTARQKSENFLVLGWRNDMEYMLQEMDSILPRGSKVTVVDEDVPEKTPGTLSNLTISWIKKRADRYGNIETLINTSTNPFDHVVVLGTAMGSAKGDGSPGGREEDAKTLATLVYVNDLIGKQRLDLSARKRIQPPTMVTVEFINEGVANIAKDQTNVANTVLPQNLGAKIAAQTVRDSRLNSVWKELLSQEGREVYLRPAGAYSKLAGERASFATVADKLAKTNDDIVIGYMSKYIAKVKINPQDAERFNARVWDGDDMLIVLSKD